MQQEKTRSVVGQKQGEIFCMETLFLESNAETHLQWCLSRKIVGKKGCTSKGIIRNLLYGFTCY